MELAKSYQRFMTHYTTNVSEQTTAAAKAAERAVAQRYEAKLQKLVSANEAAADGTATTDNELSEAIPAEPAAATISAADVAEEKALLPAAAKEDAAAEPAEPDAMPVPVVAYDGAARLAYRQSLVEPGVGGEAVFDERAFQEFKTNQFEDQWYHHRPTGSATAAAVATPDPRCCLRCRRQAGLSRTVAKRKKRL